MSPHPLRAVPSPAFRLLLCLLLLILGSGCGLRTIPPIRWVPLLGAEKQVSTTEVLIRALRDRDVTVRAEAVELLGLLATAPNDGTRRGVAKVLGGALHDADPGLRLQVVEELGKMDPKFSNSYLRSALKDPNPFVRGMVLQVLQKRESQRLHPSTPTQAAQAPAP